METGRISTGIAGVDSLLQGGFLPGRSYLITGDAGTGKTIACIQFLLSGLKQGEKAVYVTVDERPAEILHSAAALGWDLQGYVQEKSLVILDASPYFGGRAGATTEKGVDLPKIVSDLATYAKRMEAKRLAIDPVTPLILSPDSPARVQDQARLLIHLIHSQLNTTNLFSSHLSDRSDHDLTGGIEEFLASGVLIVKLAPNNGHFIRTLGVKKMRGTPMEPAEYPFKIITGQGFVLDGQIHEIILSEEQSPEALEFFELPKENP
jgi:KaiC/GvpD/RAD55 family RecA-like ATPase